MRFKLYFTANTDFLTFNFNSTASSADISGLSIVSGSSASSGAGVNFMGSSNGSPSQINNVSFSADSNISSSGFRSGIVSGTTDVTITNSSFSGIMDESIILGQSNANLSPSGARISNCIFSNVGTGIVLSSGTTITNNVFNNVDVGIAVYSNPTGGVTISSNRFSDTSQPITFDRSGTFSIVGNIFLSSSATAYGPAVYFYNYSNGPGILTGNYFQNMTSVAVDSTSGNLNIQSNSYVNSAPLSNCPGCTIGGGSP